MTAPIFLRPFSSVGPEVRGMLPGDREFEPEMRDRL